MKNKYKRYIMVFDVIKKNNDIHALIYLDVKWMCQFKFERSGLSTWGSVLNEKTIDNFRYFKLLLKNYWCLFRQHVRNVLIPVIGSMSKTRAPHETRMRNPWKRTRFNNWHWRKRLSTFADAAAGKRSVLLNHTRARIKLFKSIVTGGRGNKKMIRPENV